MDVLLKLEYPFGVADTELYKLVTTTASEKLSKNTRKKRGEGPGDFKQVIFWVITRSHTGQKEELRSSSGSLPKL